MKTIGILSFFSVLVACSLASTQELSSSPASPTPQNLMDLLLPQMPANNEYVDSNIKNPIQEIIETEGQPFEVRFKDGRVARLFSKKQLLTMNTGMILSENSCAPIKGLKCEYHLPVYRRSLFGFWTEHPTRKNQIVLQTQLDDDGQEIKEPFGRTVISYRGRDKSFADEVSKIVATPENRQLLQFVSGPQNLGWIECQQDMTSLFADKEQILFWDENFEFSNSELGMTTDSSQSVTQMTSRKQKMNLKIDGKRVVFQIPEKKFGFLSAFLPPGVSYQLQWTFKGKNIFEESDELCEMKWDLDFGRIFTFFAANISSADPSKINMSELESYNYSSNDKEDLSLQGAFERDDWERNAE